MNTIQDNQIEAPAIVIKPLDTLLGLVRFNGESVADLGGINDQEAVRLGVSLVMTGDTSKARGAFVLAKQSAKMTAKDLLEFKLAIKSEFVNEAIQAALAVVPSDASNARRELVKKQAAELGSKRYDNLGQTLRTASFMLENPKAVANGVSVFTVQQAMAYASAPVLKSEANGIETEEHNRKLAIHKKVALALAKPGTTLTEIKDVIAKAKEAVKPAAPVDSRTDAEKLAATHEAMVQTIRSKVLAVLADWQALVDAGHPARDIRETLLVRDDVSKGTVAGAIGSLAILAGLPLAQAEVPKKK